MGFAIWKAGAVDLDKEQEIADDRVMKEAASALAKGGKQVKALTAQRHATVATGNAMSSAFILLPHWQFSSITFSFNFGWPQAVRDLGHWLKR